MPQSAEDDLVCGVLQGTGTLQRRALSKVITLLESTRQDHRLRAERIMEALLPHSGKSLRLGISGAPGVGKSTFIEALGMHLVREGHRVAVLAIDPSSAVSGGSILGDKTRMERLSVHPRAYIRPAPACGIPGGVAQRTREVMLVTEAAGHDVVLVETVGVGQSELAVATMTDIFLLLHLPNSGDDLQALKRGVMELADMVVINKSDLDALAAARAQAQISSALSLFRRPAGALAWQVPVVRVSALRDEGLADLMRLISLFQTQACENGRFSRRREEQNKDWFWQQVDAGLRAFLMEHPRVSRNMARTEREVAAGMTTPSVAARQLLTFLDEQGWRS